MKKILIIGAGFLQTFVIRKAKEMGYYVFCVDGNPLADGFKFADEYQVIDITDKEKCLQYAQRNDIDGVMTAATDYGVITASYIANALNLRGVSMETAATPRMHPSSVSRRTARRPSRSSMPYSVTARSSASVIYFDVSGPQEVARERGSWSVL